MLDIFRYLKPRDADVSEGFQPLGDRLGSLAPSKSLEEVMPGFMRCGFFRFQKRVRHDEDEVIGPTTAGLAAKTGDRRKKDTARGAVTAGLEAETSGWRYFGRIACGRTGRENCFRNGTQAAGLVLAAASTGAGTIPADAAAHARGLSRRLAPEATEPRHPGDRNPSFGTRQVSGQNPGSRDMPSDPRRPEKPLFTRYR